MRKVFIKPNKQLYILVGNVLKLLCPLYGLADNGNDWNKTFAEHLKGTYGMDTV